MDTSLYSPTLLDAEDAADWVRSWTAVGGFPHPDDTALLPDGTLGIVGPAFPADLDPALAAAYDAAKLRAIALLDAAGIDIYDLILSASYEVENEDDIVVYLKVRVPNDPDDTITRRDVVDGLLARLDEFYPVDTYPVVPVVEVIDGPDGSVA